MAQLEVYRIDPTALQTASHEVFLEGEEAHHLLKVRRARPGDEVILIDGLGTAYTASLMGIEGNQARMTLGEAMPEWREPPLRVHLGLGLLKADHFGDAVNFAVQAGVGEITPLQCRHAIAGWSEGKQERTQRIALTAAKQCGRGRIPPLHPVQPLADWCIQTSGYDHRLLLDPDGSELPSVAAGATVALAIGPEGGFHEEEVTALKDAGFHPISLGQRRLRSETAVLAALAHLVIPLETSH